MDFRSDNVSGALPEVVSALAEASQGRASAYGDDPLSAALSVRLSELFEREVLAFPVATGSAANALGLALYTPPWGAIYADAHAHIQVSECGAPEFYTAGAKVVAVLPRPGSGGKLAPEALHAAIVREGAVHAVQPAVVSISQATELGAVYAPEELGALAAAARKHGMALHVDGARFANALVASGRSPAELSWRAGVDVLALGGTKNGCLMAELVVAFDGARTRELAFRRKRAGQLLSKMRFASAQLLAYFADGLWLRSAAHANRQAAQLAEGLAALGVPLATPVQTNQVFPCLSDTHAAALRAAGAQFYDWPSAGPGARRLVTAFDTADADVAAFLTACARVAGVAPAPC